MLWRGKKTTKKPLPNEKTLGDDNQCIVSMYCCTQRTHHVPGSVSEAPGLLVLAGQDEGPQLGLVYPVDPADDLQRGQHPPGVTHVRKLPVRRTKESEEHQTK